MDEPHNTNNNNNDGNNVDDGHTDRECDVCYENKRNTRLPCGHSNMCEACAQNTLNRTGVCPVCREGFSKAWCSPQFTNEPQFVDVNEREMAGFRRLVRTAPPPVTPVLHLQAQAQAWNFNERPSSDISCRQVSCLYLCAFSVAVVLVFVGALTTNWQCESMTCLCELELPGHESGVCASICSCMSTLANPEGSINQDVWQEPDDSRNEIHAEVCEDVTVSSEQCEALFITPEYLKGECLTTPELHQPCGGRSVSYYTFAAGWYAIILLTNLLLFLCFCYCLGSCRASYDTGGDHFRPTAIEMGGRT